MRALRESPWADEVWECSHIGGDRFAGNLVLLPDSLYFGALRRRGRRARCWPRTMTAGSTWPTSAVARRSAWPSRPPSSFVRAETGLDALDAVRSVEALDDGRHRVVVDDGGRDRSATS